MLDYRILALMGASLLLAIPRLAVATEDAPTTEGAKAEGAKAEGAKAEGLVMLHIQTDDRNVQLRQVVAEGYQMVPYMAHFEADQILCRTPCNKLIDGRMGQQFYFSGSGVTDSSRFDLLDYRGSVVTRVNPGSQVLRTISKVSLWVGVPVTAIGGSVFLAMSSSQATDTEGIRTMRNVGAGMMIGGAVFLVGSLVMSLASRTTYEFESTTAQP